MNERSKLIAALAAVLAFVAATAALAFPIAGKPIRVIVPFPAGGEVIDGTARVIAHRLGEALGASVIVENRPGAGNVIGNQAVAASLPDGHTLLYGAVTSFTLLPHQLSKRPYDEFRDFTPITHVARFALFLVSHPSLPVENLRGLIEYAKANPGKISFASWQLGGLNHLYLELLKAETGVDLLHVPYKSFLDSQRDLIEGRIHLMMSGTSTNLSWARSGRLKILGVASAKRMSGLQEFPTFGEQGLRGFDQTGSLAFFGPAGLPFEIVKRLNNELARILRSPEFVDFVARVSPAGEVEPSSPEELAALIRAQYDHMGPIIRRLGIRLD
jgi:tripartite-type tricarboxylate transporter receptor subunit TctC